MIDTVLQIAKAKAEHRTVSARIQSTMGTKIHQWMKPGNAARFLTSIGTNFIPKPGIGTVVDWSVDKLAAKIQDRLRARRLKLATDDYRRMKFAIKTLDVEHLDNSRRKVIDCIDALRKAIGEHSGGRQPCRTAYRLAYRYYRLENRLLKLSAEAATLVEVGQQVLDWTANVEKQLDEAGMKKCAEQMLQGDHRTCGRDCFLAEMAAPAPVGPARAAGPPRPVIGAHRLPGFVNEEIAPGDD